MEQSTFTTVTHKLIRTFTHPQMYNLNDTIVAVSSPTSDKAVIVRVTGPDTIEVCRRTFGPAIPKSKAGLFRGAIAVDTELKIDAELYLFLTPHSYTGEDLTEIHIYTNPAVTEALMARLLSNGLRMAGPGEFTARAYLNGKIDLAQAEAVNEIVTSSNKFQLTAAEKLLSGQLAEATDQIGSHLLDCLGLIEAGLDFSSEDIEFITVDEAVKKVTDIEQKLQQLLAGSVRYESVIDLPAVGIAGAPNAGKSSLLNKLLDQPRSIVSEQQKTTRDVLTGRLSLAHCQGVLFDCAGLMQNPDNILDELAQRAAIEALQNSSLVIFCVDISKDHWAEDLSIRQLVEPRILIPVATKSDLLSEELLADRVVQLGELFDANFLATSAKTGAGLEPLRDIIDTKLIEKFEIPPTSGVTLIARHRQAVTEAIENTDEAINELKAGNDEVAAMMLRAAYQHILNIDQHIDEKILDGIFSRFCIGK